MYRLTALIGLLALLPDTLSSQAPDTAYMRLVREATSDPRFLPASVATIPDHPTIPSPRDHFGTINATNLRRAHALIEQGAARGKIVLEGF